MFIPHNSQYLKLTLPATNHLADPTKTLVVMKFNSSLVAAALVGYAVAAPSSSLVVRAEGKCDAKKCARSVFARAGEVTGMSDLFFLLLLLNFLSLEALHVHSD